MRALSLTQPWATLVAIGAKHVETRSWRTSYRGPIAIHAAKNFPRDAREIAIAEPCRSALSAAGYSLIGELPLGAIIAVRHLERCEPTGLYRPVGFETSREHAFGDYSPGRFAWVFSRSYRRLSEPVPCRGALGIWTVPEDIELLVRDRERPRTGGDG